MPDNAGAATQEQAISFADMPTQLCPFHAYDRLRDEQPVYRDPGTGNYVLTRYQDIRQVATKVKIFSNRIPPGALRDTSANDAAELRAKMLAIYDERGWRPIHTMLTNDAPEHRFYRGVVEKAFNPTKIARLEPRIEEIIDGLIDGFIDREEVEFLDAFAIKLPMYVIAEQLGIPRKDFETFKLWSDVSVDMQNPNMSAETAIRNTTILTDMQRYMADNIERVRKEPEDTILSRLVHADVDGRQLDMRELQSVLQQLLVAGNETTTTTLASAVQNFIERPGLAERLHDEPDRIETFVEETLRRRAPVQVLFRKALEDFELQGVTIPAGSIVELRWGAGNLDAAMFADPDDIQLDRVNASRHLAFGNGPHMCLGNQLARSELRLAVSALVRRMRNFRATRGDASYEYVSLYIAHGPSRLWMAFDKR